MKLSNGVKIIHPTPFARSASAETRQGLRNAIKVFRSPERNEEYLKRLIITFILAFFLSVTQAFPFSSSDINNLIHKYEMEKSNIAIKVVTLPDNKTTYERNADAPMVIASNTKLFSTATALCKLGPDFKFTTSISYDGFVVSNTLQGNLVAWSNGDPNISGRFYDNNPTAVFEQWADKLVKSGIREIKGDLIIDQSAFDKECIPSAWPQGQLSYWYCAPISAVSFNDNCVEITVFSNPKTGKISYTLSPQTKYVDVSFKVKLDKKLSANQLRFSRAMGTNRINISGRVFPQGIPFKEFITVENPGLFFGTVLKETLARKGIVISGEILVVDEPYKPSPCVQEMDKLYRKPVKIAETSTDLVQTINVVNKRSQNFYAEQILKVMAYNYQEKGTLPGGLKIVREFLSREIGFAHDSFAISDGSGLSRENCFSVNQIINLLRYMHRHKHFTVFRDSLNYERWRFSNMESVWTKTGYIKNALALSGYIRRGKDDYYAFSIIVNGFEELPDGMDKIGQFRDEFIQLLLDK